MMEQIEVSTRGHQAFHDITAEVQTIVSRSRVQEGVCFIFCPHATAGMTLNENWDPDVQHDIGVGLDTIAPPRPEYRHGEGNSPAHLRCSLVGASQFVPVAMGKLVLGTWQGIFLAEFDGPRRRKVMVKVIAG
ncbi:MAG: secondary thiamine-phosphate synthase enzyme YjbQ [Chloroflexota bacterium]|nr:secondary thiamine-phosphate synthase enzyme YjbQ [Chloroflexota bacterium]